MRFPPQNDTTLDERQLVVAAKYGNTEAFDRLVERYAPRLHAVARRMVGEDRAPDMVQDAFLSAFKTINRFKGDASFSTYLHTIVVNRCKREMKRQRPSFPLKETLRAKSITAEKLVEADYMRKCIERSLQIIPETFREALVLREFSELSYAEIASVLDISEGTVKSRIARARAMLRLELEKMGVKP